MTRSEVATLVAKVFAFIACGQPERARPLAAKLIDWLERI